MTSSVSTALGTPAPIWRRAFDWWLVQVKHVLPPTLFFFVGFNLMLFLVYVTAHELNTLFGDGELARLFLRWHSSEAKLTRRQRIRLLTRLNRLTVANSVEVISERGSPAHAELVEVLRQLAARPGGKSIHT